MGCHPQVTALADVRRVAGASSSLTEFVVVSTADSERTSLRPKNPLPREQPLFVLSKPPHPAPGHHPSAPWPYGPSSSKHPRWEESCHLWCPGHRPLSRVLCLHGRTLRAAPPPFSLPSDIPRRVFRAPRPCEPRPACPPQPPGLRVPCALAAPVPSVPLTRAVLVGVGGVSSWL